jgi:hypothetical protein
VRASGRARFHLTTPLEECTVNRKTTSFLIAATVGTAAGLAVSSHAYADDITIDTNPFTSTATRAEVQAQLKVPFPGGYPWSSQYRQAAPKGSTYTSQQAKADYVASRQEVNALNGEDSGAAYFGKMAGRTNSTATMGGPAR